MQHRLILPRFLVFYAGLFAAFGVASPFLPGLLQQDGLGPGSIGLVLAAGTAIRLLAGPAGGRLADRTGRPAIVLFGFTAAAALVALGYVPARGLPLLLLVSVVHATVLAPLTPIADALALGSSRVPPRFDYGWVRATGSAAFIVGTLASGQCVARWGLSSIVWNNAWLLAVAAAIAWLLPNLVAGTRARSDADGGSTRSLLAIPSFRLLMLVAALVGGSHALHDSFEVIRWRAAGLSASEASMLWSISVAAEFVMFLFLGRRILARVGPAHAMVLAAVAGIVRWSAAALTARFAVMAVVEPLHGLSFALLHLACMEMIGRVVPAGLAATAQAFYATVAMGGVSAAVTLAAGPLYFHLGAGAFWPMAAMCALAVPVAMRITAPAGAGDAAWVGGHGR